MLSLSAASMPPEAAEAVGFDGPSLRDLSHTWYAAGRQALYSGGFESRPRHLQIAVFIISQLHWTMNDEGETLNSCLGQAVRNAQAMRMDRDIAGADTIETETRRRLWWELWVCDTFQALCYGRTPLIQTDPDRVPLMANCDDEALTETSVAARPSHIPTDTSGSIARAKAFKILHRLFAGDWTHMRSWEHVSALDRQLQEY